MGFKNKFKAQGKEVSRIQNFREERAVKGELPKICFNFKDFDRNQCPPGQTYEEWQDDKLLAYMLTKFGYVCECTVQEAQQKRIMTIYSDFPSNSDFKTPKYILGDVKWAVIKDIKGQKARVAGYIIYNVFYVVFLDKNHLFYKMKDR
ncbi:MAG: hypothetical protein LUC88_00195 [Prevotella sp.]|nr:hypothetical protein [Prevotella sp.]